MTICILKRFALRYAANKDAKHGFGDRLTEWSKNNKANSLPISSFMEHMIKKYHSTCSRYVSFYRQKRLCRRKNIDHLYSEIQKEYGKLKSIDLGISELVVALKDCEDCLKKAHSSSKFPRNTYVSNLGELNNRIDVLKTQIASEQKKMSTKDLDKKGTSRSKALVSEFEKRLETLFSKLDSIENRYDVWQSYYWVCVCHKTSISVNTMPFKDICITSNHPLVDKGKILSKERKFVNDIVKPFIEKV